MLFKIIKNMKAKTEKEFKNINKILERKINELL
jgi:hypothetical protein